MKINDICDYLSFRVSPDYKLVSFKNCVFNEVRNELKLTFLYDDSIKKKMGDLKARLEQEFRDQVKLDIKYIFEYKSSYMDEDRLGLLVKGFLNDNFSIMTLDLYDEDIRVTDNGNTFNVDIHLPKHTAVYVRASKSYDSFVKNLMKDYFHGFNFTITPKATDDNQTMADIEKFIKESVKDIKASGVDKVCKVKDVEYLLGKPIKERPIKIEFLKTNPDEQVIAGTISFLTKREYTKKATEDKPEEKKPYWTFVIDDGVKKQSCVFFPTTNTLSKFEKLVNGTTICAIGVNDERNGRVNFSVKGISFCEMV